MRRRWFLTTGIAGLASAFPAPDLQTEDEPATAPPNGARVLFDGRDLSAWVSVKTGEAPAWKVQDGSLEIVLGTGDLRTRDEFRDFQLHLEFRIPDDPGRSRGNSGVYLQGKYEIQIIDSWGRPPESNGCGALYREAPPLRNASKPPGRWQAFDIAFRMPRYDQAGVFQEPGRLTVFHNRVLIHNNLPVPGMTGQARRNPQNDPRKPGPIVLQNHGSPVRFRNIWLCSPST